MLFLVFFSSYFFSILIKKIIIYFIFFIQTKRHQLKWGVNYSEELSRMFVSWTFQWKVHELSFMNLSRNFSSKWFTLMPFFREVSQKFSLCLTPTRKHKETFGWTRPSDYFPSRYAIIYLLLLLKKFYL